MNVHDAKTLTRVPLPDVSKAEISSNKEMENSLNLVDTDMAKPSVCRTDRKENGKIGCSLDETTSSLHNSSHLSPQPLEYDFGCSEHNNSPFNGKSSEFKLVMSGSSAKEFAHSCLEGQSKFTLKCDAQLHMEEIEAICENMSNDLEDFCSSSSGPKNLGLKSAPFDGNDSTPYAYLALDAKSITSEAFENIFDASNLIPYTSKVDYRKHCSTRRRCLVFEMAGRKNMLDKSDGSSSNSMLYQRDTASSGMQLDTSKNNSGSSLFPLPSMGLHLNTLTSTSKKRMIIQENLVSSDLVNATCSDSLVPSLAAMKKPKVNFMPVNENPGSAVHGDQVPPLMQESPIEPAATSNELKRSNPKKKRFDNSKEDESCRRCNCKKSKCLKLYCECFAAGVYCTEPCACHNCFNKPIDEEIVLNTRKQIELRNPLAFAPKVIWTSEYTPEIGEDAIKTPASARHKRGCNCRRSNCLKKYCECFQGGVGCSVHCRCEGCRNSYGMKVGTDAVGLHEAKYVESESSSCHKDGEGENSQQGGSLTCVVQRDEKQDTELKMTLKPPLQICSKPTKLSLISTGKLMQSSKVVPGLKACKTILKSKISPIKPKFEQQCRVSEDETFEMLKECSSPISSVKVASPRRKRVSPPHNGTGMGPQKGLRKLVLKSISSSPSLTLDSNNPAIVPRNLLSSFPNKG